MILLFLFTGCVAAPVHSIDWLDPADRIYSETEDPVLVLTNRSPQEVLEAIQQASLVTIDFQSDESLYATIHTEPTKRVVVVENDLDGDEAYLIMITTH